MIDMTRKFVETKLGAEVIYGDTDSVMVRFKVPENIRGKR